MKKIRVVIALVAVAAVGGHYVLWQKQLTLLEQQIERVSNDDIEGKKITFTYESKESGGYPMSAMVRYVNPVLTIAPEAFAHEDGSAPSLTVDLVKVNGALVVRNAYAQNTSALELTGTLHVTGTQAEKPYAYVGSWKDTSRCAVTLAGSPLAFIDGTHGINNAKTSQDFIRAISRVECGVKELMVRDEARDKDVANIGKQNLTLTSSPSKQKDQHIVGLNVSVKDAMLYASAQSELGGLEYVLAEEGAAQNESLLKLLQKHPVPWFDPSLAGKQNMTLRGEFEGSLDNPKPPFRVNVEELSIANDFYTMKWPFAFEATTNNDVIIRHHGMMKHTEAFDRVAQESVDALLAIAQDDELEIDDRLRVRLKALDAKMLHGLMPALFSAGEIQTMANLNMNGEASTATIEEAGFTTALFGLTAKGSADVKQMKLDMQMVCHSCDALITNVSAYVNNAMSVMSIMDGTLQRFTITEEASKALSSFLQSYDTDENPATVTITIKNDGKSDTMISDKSAGVVMMDALGKLSPHFGSLIVPQ